jgi:hypothetical protein
MSRKVVFSSLLVGLMASTFAVATPVLAKQGADDAAGHVRQGRGADDAAGHVRRGRGADDTAAAASTARRAADDPAGHVRRGRGADDVKPHK